MTYNCLFQLYEVGPDQYGNADTDTRVQESFDIQYTGRYSTYSILNAVIKYARQRYVIKTEYLTNFIPNIRALNS